MVPVAQLGLLASYQSFVQAAELTGMRS